AGRDETLARQVAEVLRAELLLAPERPAKGASSARAPAPQPHAVPIANDPPPPSSSIPSTEWPRHAGEPPATTLLAVLSVAPTLTVSPGSPGSLTTQPHLGIDLQLYPFRGLRLQGLGLVPLRPAEIVDHRGTIYAAT